MRHRSALCVSAYAGGLYLVEVTSDFWPFLIEYCSDCLNLYLDEKGKENGLTPESFKRIETEKGNAKAV